MAGPNRADTAVQSGDPGRFGQLPNQTNSSPVLSLNLCSLHKKGPSHMRVGTELTTAPASPLVVGAWHAAGQAETI